MSVPAATRVSRDWSGLDALLVGSLFLIAFALAGVRIAESGVLDYRLFGLVEGILAVLLVWLLVRGEALSWPRGGWGIVVLVYAAAATAQILAVLLPPPGVVQWLALAFLLLLLWGAGYGAHRTRLVLNLGLAALALAVLRYSFLPFVWERTQLPRTPLLDLRALGEGFRALFIEYRPPDPRTQWLVLGAIAAWAAAMWIQWPPESESSWVRRLSRAERDRLLYWMLGERMSESHSIEEPEPRGHLEPGRRK